MFSVWRVIFIASPVLVAAFPQNQNSATAKISQADGFVFDGPVVLDEQRTTSWPTNVNSDSRVNATTIASTSPSTTTVPPDVQFTGCVMFCPVTSEYNPVCGTDNVDYTNPGQLGCAQRCGKDVTLQYYGRCSTGRTG